MKTAKLKTTAQRISSVSRDDWHSAYSWFVVIVLLVIIASGVAASRAYAHSLNGLHWNRYGASVTIEVWNLADRYYGEASTAIGDWRQNTILNLPQRSYHTDVTVMDENWPWESWPGRAYIYSSGSSHIYHVHAILNEAQTGGYSWGQRKAVFCQELGHGFGLDHSTPGCMGFRDPDRMGPSYWSTVSHNWSDIYSMYRFSHH